LFVPYTIYPLLQLQLVFPELLVAPVPQLAQFAVAFPLAYVLPEHWVQEVPYGLSYPGEQFEQLMI
jgi:hypothetical protein